MSNVFFQIYDKSGNSLLGPVANNTLWSGFGGDCENDNSGDPIVLYDQFADRWLLTQFTASGPTFFNCVALSQTGDPTGAYFRWAFTTGANFPDYPKYGIWSDAYVISTREFAGTGGAYLGVGAYAIDRDAMITGDPNPVIIDFFVDRSTPRLVGDGLLPADIDGPVLPPNGAPHYMLGTQDDGGPYSATQDALLLWKFVIDFDTPANSSFTLTDTLPIANFDTQFSLCSGRSCIPQPDTTNALDILAYRQRPLHRLAYRNFGTHESLVTLQSVEGAPGIAGMRWWEVRDPDGTPVIFQEGTFAPGATDGIHRWMGSAAMDGSGNIALGYSASSPTVFPGVRYAGRLESDPLGTLDQGEEVIIEGTGSQTGSSRWGDYTSLNIDPIDDCTFWHVNQYVPTTSSGGWRLRIGAFGFDECGEPGFVINTPVSEQDICVGTDANYDITGSSFGGFSGEITLSVIGNPTGTTATFSVNPIMTPGSSVLTIGSTGGAAAGNYMIDVEGTSPGAVSRTRTLSLDVFDAIPSMPLLSMPADAAVDVEFRPAFSWSGTGAQSYRFELATDDAFSNVVLDTMVATTTLAPGFDLDSSTTYYWRVSASNACGDSADSAIFSFTTAPAPGDCGLDVPVNESYSYGFEAGAGGWTSSGTGDTWAQSSQRVNSGSFSWKAVDPPSTSDQRLVSPPLALPNGESPLTLQFFHYRDIENSGDTQCWDAGILEISTNGGSSWTQLDNPVLLTDPYTGTIRTSANPLQNLNGWCNLQDWTKSVVDLDAFAGQTAQFRFRLGSDASVGAEGWYIDDVKVQSCRDESFIFADGYEN